MNKGYVIFSWDELFEIQNLEDNGYESKNRNLKRLAYAIHFKHCKENNLSFREILTRLKWVKKKLKEIK